MVKKSRGTLLRRLEKIEQRIVESDDNVETVMCEWFSYVEFLIYNEEKSTDEVEVLTYDTFKNDKEFRKRIKAQIADYEGGEQNR